MENFKQSGRGFRYDTASEGDIIRIDVYYSKGGDNSGTKHRGVYISVQPLKLEVRDHLTISSFAGYSGARFFVSALPRKNDKALATIAGLFDSTVKDKAAEFLTAGANLAGDFVSWVRDAASIPVAQ